VLLLENWNISSCVYILSAPSAVSVGIWRGDDVQVTLQSQALRSCVAKRPGM
jgi:hypothetical protein